jgi:UDP-N-acetylglucosamine 2-epimerase (non-hydrolysing)
VLFPAGYRTQKIIAARKLEIPNNIKIVDPIGYLEFLELLTHSKGVFTDSGTVVEEACILGIPSIQMRTSTERPEVYISNSSVKFDPHSNTSVDLTLKQFYQLKAGTWTHLFGDGSASHKIASDIIFCYEKENFTGHDPKLYDAFSARSFM